MAVWTVKFNFSKGNSLIDKQQQVGGVHLNTNFHRLVSVNLEIDWILSQREQLSHCP